MSANIIRIERTITETELRRESPETEQVKELLIEIRHELRQLREEVRIMGQTQQDQDTQIASDVTALTNAFTGFETAVAAEIAAAKSSPAAADPVVAQALTNIEALTAKIVADTAAAQPPADTTGDGSIPTITG
jgi:predicted  nucleic acid-binding Zn-ribbon protein